MRSKRGLAGDKRGAVAVMVAASSLALLCVAGLTVDTGNVFTAQRSVQGATDLAAIAAASDLPNAQSVAAANAVANNYAGNEVTDVTLGTYTANPAIPPALRFQPAAPPAANAVRVTMMHQQPLFFANAFNLLNGGGGRFANTAPVTAQAIATTQRTVSFEIGSRVAAFQGGIVNALLGAAVGGNVSLSLIDYNALASANVSLFDLANALSFQVGKVGASYGQLFSGPVALSDFIAALQTAAPNVAPELQQLQSAAKASGATIDLSRLVDFGPYANQSVNEPAPPTTATASVLNLMQASLGLGGAAHVINLNLAVNIPGITSVTGKLTVGEPPVGSTLIGVDVQGTTLHTSQVRLFLNVSLLSSVAGGAVTLPLYLEIGYGTASLANVTCTPLDPSGTQVKLNVTPGLANGWIGTVTDADMTNYTAEPTPGPATLLNLVNIATVTGRANATIGNLSPTAVNFTQSDIQSVAVKTTTTTDFAGALIASLVGNLSMQVNVLGLPLLVPPGLTSSVSGVLTSAVSPVDQLVSSLLQTIGVGVGQADTWVSGARCGAAVLAG